MIPTLRFLTILGLAGAAVFAAANPATYALNVDLVSGKLNGVSFGRRLVTFTGIADTDNIVQLGENDWAVAFTQLTVDVQGIGSDTIALPWRVEAKTNVDDGTCFISFNRTSRPFQVLGVTTGPAGYDLSTSSTSSGTGSWTPGAVYTTSSGQFNMTSISSGGVSFAANVSAVPEPASLIVLGLGVAGFVRRRKVR